MTIWAKLLVAFAVPTTALFALFAIVAHEVARRDLEVELGRRLEAIAASAALQIRGKYLTDLAAGDEDHRAYQNALRKLEALRDATGVARIYVFDRDFGSRVDTVGDVGIGQKHFQAEIDRHEIDRVFERGQAVSSVLFQGPDGALYKAGYAPVTASENEPEIVLALGVDAPAAYFERLADLRRSLLVYGAVLVVIVVLIAVLMAALITRPVRALVSAAERIGRGDLEAAVARTSRDELGFLAETMEAMRRDLAARDERLQLMLSGIAHEVRNPLGGIELFTGILREELAPDDERRRHVERIARELGYLEAVVNDFLDYARRPKPELSPCDVGELVRDVCELCAADAERKGVALRCPGKEVGASALVDRGQIRRVVLNLVGNAIAASDGQVTVDARRDGQRVRIAVHNTGAPIAPEVRERMFEPFYTTREKGTGLGLAFVREIIADHGGTIEVRTGDAGTEIAVTLRGS